MSEERLTYEGILRFSKEQALKQLAEGKSLEYIIVGIVNHVSMWAGENVRQYQKDYPVKPEPKVEKSPWRPISSAPKDGTMILVTETPNGEHWNVVPACWMSQGAGRDEGHPLVADQSDNSCIADWWGITPSRRSDHGPLYTHWLPLAITPVCWMPFPAMEDEAKLNRRMSQLYKD